MLVPVTKIKRTCFCFVFFFFLRNLGEDYERAIEIHTSRRVSAFLSRDACISPRALLFFAEIRDYSQSTLGNTLLRELEQEGKTETCPKRTLFDKVSPISAPPVLRNKDHILRKLNKIARNLIHNHMSLRS